MDALGDKRVSDMTHWQGIETVEPGATVLVYGRIEQEPSKHVFEAIAYTHGAVYDPVYGEWSGMATHWAKLPDPPIE